MLQTNILRFIGFFIWDIDWRNFARGFHYELVCFDFDFSSRKIRVDCIRSPELYFTSNRNHRFKVSFFDKTEEAAARMHYDLSKTVMIAQVYKQNTSVVSQTKHPA